MIEIDSSNRIRLAGGNGVSAHLRTRGIFDTSYDFAEAGENETKEWISQAERKSHRQSAKSSIWPA